MYNVYVVYCIRINNHLASTELCITYIHSLTMLPHGVKPYICDSIIIEL